MNLTVYETTNKNKQTTTENQEIDASITIRKPILREPILSSYSLLPTPDRKIGSSGFEPLTPTVSR
jgi:hypothetical protein